MNAVHRHPHLVVTAAAIASLAIGITSTPLWDEDEPRFAAIARTMVDSGDWVVPMYNGELAVDKPVLMHWAMAAASTIFGTTEFACRLPAVLATLLTALALLRAGTRWFDVETGAVAALAFVGCLLVGIEAHAATPDAILTCLTTWATVLFAEPVLATGAATAPHLPRLSTRRAAFVGGILGLAVLCKGPVGFVGPLAVVCPWVWWLALERRRATAAGGDTAWFGDGLRACGDVIRVSRPVVLGAAMLAVAAPWYTAVSLRTEGAWLSGFFFVHNVGRFVAPMERHGGSILLHPLAMLVGFYPWSCFLPLAVVVSVWRIRRRVDAPQRRAALALAVVWLAVWVGGFSVAATKLPNYVLPAYPAAALLVGVLAAAAAARGSWAHPSWLASGTVCLALGGLMTAATVVVAARFGIPGGEPAALVGLVPLVGAVCLWFWRHTPARAIAALVVTGLLFSGLAVGPAAARLAAANTLPGLVREAHRHAGGRARLGTFTQITPNVVYYADGSVAVWQAHERDACVRFLTSGSDAVVLVREEDFPTLAPELPQQVGIVGRARPLFRSQDFLLVGTHGHRSVCSIRPPACSETILR